MKQISVILFSMLILVSCSKNIEKKVEYEVSGAISDYKLQYIDDTGMLKDTLIQPESIEDIWQYNYLANEGDIVYVLGKYNDINSALRISIKIDGKIYKEGFSIGDTVKYLIVSGVIPYQ